ncbi:hypothetical protein KR054_007034 [Drosophila jambulina]|nr:hypothetical protein KR054_007034 [Drosophila jambulina]
MALWRWSLLRLSNRYLSYHVLLLLRFYLAQYHCLGLMRLRFVAGRNEVRLTPYSLTVARMIGLWLAYFFTLAVGNPYHLMLHMQLLGFSCSIVLQPRRVVEERMRLVNEFLRLTPQLYRCCRRKLKMSWLAILQWLLKFLILRMFYMTLLIPKDTSYMILLMLLFVVPTALAIWVMDVTSHLVSIVLFLLLKSFQVLDEEMAEVGEKLPLEILRGNYGEVRRLQRHLVALQRLHRSYVRLTQDVISCLGPQLVLILLYNLSTIYTLSSGRWRRVLQISVLVNSVRSLLVSLDQLVAMTGVRKDTTWLHVAQLLQFDEILATHGWLERKKWKWRWRCQDPDSKIPILQPGLQVLGLVIPNRRLLFRIVFAFCSVLHLHYMWKRSPLVAEKEVLIDSEIVSKSRVLNLDFLF